ncbi:hypothetical protein HDU86_003356 [Geranomyces michiganensis]|nr:hypothetical protein HDU86_003356 [Geranomyces michiganensis]
MSQPMSTQQQYARPKKPLELRHLSTTKLLDPDDLGIGQDFGADAGVDVGEESIPNYDGKWDGETDSIHGRPTAKDVVARSSGGSIPSPSESLSHDGPPPASVAGAAEEAQRRSSSSSHHSNTGHDAGASRSRGSSRTPAYRPQAGPVVYKQLDFDDEHDDGGDIIVMGESDIDMHSPTEGGPHDWAGREGTKEGGGWFARRLWGMMQMICAAPASK